MSDVNDSFADAPVSISELRSNKTDRARDWTPRDVLISLLRDIDRGEVKIDIMVVCMAQRIPGESVTTDYRNCGAANLLESTGLVARTLHRLNVTA